MSLPLEPVQPPGGAASGAADPLTLIRRRQQQLAANDTEVFEIAEYGGDLAIRYRRLPLAQYRETLLGSAGSEWERYAQFLIEACDELLRRDPDGDLVPLVDGRKTTFNDVGQALGFPDDNTVRQDVLAVWGGNDIRLVAHGDEVAAWMRSAQDAADQEVVGGS
jgi:hypothetical protein